MALECIFVAADGRFSATAHAGGPWDPEALHGGAPAALITSAFESMHPGGDLQIGRLSFQFLRPVPARPLTLLRSVRRPGRRVRELAAELWHGEMQVCRASALLVQPVEHLPAVGDGEPAEPEVRAGHQATQTDAGEQSTSKGLGDEPTRQRMRVGVGVGEGMGEESRRRAHAECGTGPSTSMRGPEAGTPVRFALDDPARESFASSAMEMRWLTDPWALGAGRVWMRLQLPLTDDGQRASPLASLAAVADFGNGVSAELPFDTHLFINADLTIHLHRQPRGEWIGLDASTTLHPGGAGLAESVLHDRDGPVGRAFQTLVVQAR